MTLHQQRACIRHALRLAFSLIPLAIPVLANPLAVGNFLVSNVNANGFVITPSALSPADTNSFDLTGGNNGGGFAGETDFLWQAPSAGTVSFQWAYTSCYPPWQNSFACDSPTYDAGGYKVGTLLTQLTDTDTGPIFSSASFTVNAGASFGWYVGTSDNLGEPGTLTISSMQFDAAVTAAPEPQSWLLLIAGIAFLVFRNRRRMPAAGAAILALCMGASLHAQNVYAGTAVTGQLLLVRSTNLTQIGSAPTHSQFAAQVASSSGPELPKFRAALPAPPPRNRPSQQQAAAAGQAAVTPQSLSVTGTPTIPGFDGLTHRDQRLANGANQFSLEPPNPSIAAASGKVLEGVNDAVRVFASDGTALIPAIASNQLFGLAPAIDRTQTPNVYGVYTTDMRVFYDQDINRWMVLQRSQDEDSAGNPLNQSHIYLAVSRTADPVGDYNIYVMDTSNTANPGCPCVDDYPQIGADRYGLYISSNEYSLFDPNNPSFNYDATILAISKADLASGTSAPTTVRFMVGYVSGYEFTIQPATTPPGAQPMLASGGVEFFASSYAVGFDSNLAVWALSNTASLQSAKPSMLLTETTLPTLPYVPPPYAVPQKPGPLTLGTTLETLDAGYFSDSRVLSTSYSGGRLFVTLASSVVDSLNHTVSGGLYVVFSPTFRNGVLGASAPVKQGYLAATGNHILRPAVAVNSLGRGVIAFTLVGNSYYPSSAFVNIDLTPSTPSVIQMAAAGSLPEDGFSGYPASDACPGCSGFGIARWGDFSTAAVSTDGSIWFVNEYIPNALRTPLANWGTFISKVQP